MRKFIQKLKVATSILLFFFIFMGFTISVKSQLLVNLQFPSSGMVQKSQLWNMILTNNSAVPKTIHINLLLSDDASSQQIFSASTNLILLNPGVNQINSSMTTINYNVLSNSYGIDNSPNGVLPVGNFMVCYNFFESDLSLIEECHDLIIEPLTPPQLIYPYNKAAIPESYPQFSWLPPAPLNLFINPSYDLNITEIYSGQGADDAILQNPPVYSQQNISTTAWQYPQSAITLDHNKEYAWQIIVRSDGLLASHSETWKFVIKNFQKTDSLRFSQPPFAKLRKTSEPGYAIFTGELKFDYFNETTDSVWNINIRDNSIVKRSSVIINMDSVPLKPGQNLVILDVSDNDGFIEKHLYLMEVKNSRNEIWRLEFEYRKPKESEQ